MSMWFAISLRGRCTVLRFFYGKKMQGTGGKDMEGTSNTVDVVVVEEHFQNL